MLVVNDSIKNAYSKYTTQRKSYIRVDNSSFFVQNLDVSADAYLDGNVIGNAIAKIVKFDIETVNVSGIDEFELFDGIWTGNQYEYISLGTFKLFNEEGTDDFFSSITAYDKLVLFNKEYDPTQTIYPITLYGLLKNICNQAGVELENTSIPNGNQTITSNLFVENETLKNVLNAISQISGNYAIISKDKLKLLLKGTETINLNKSQISNPEYKRTTWKINQVVLGMSDIEGEYVLRQDVTDIEKNGIHKLVISDNPFVYTQELRETYIDNLFNKVKGFGYTAFGTQWEGLPYIELGDLLNIDGKESVVLRYNLKSPDGLKSTLSAPSIIDSVVEYVDNSNSIKNRQKRTEILVDKQNQRIDAIASDVNKNTEKVASLEITTGNISTKVSSVETDLNTTNTNLSNLSNTVDTLSDDINGVSADFEEFKDNEYIQSIDNLQKQIDGAIQFWNGAEIPTVNNYPANGWTTENDKINHQADIYTVVQDVQGEMKQGKSYRFDKIDGVWQWIELTDNELSAVQAIAQEALNKANANATEIGTVKTRVSSLEQTDEQIKASVESIDKQIIPTASVSGSNIYIEDASDNPLTYLEIEGKSTQKTRKGYNKSRLNDTYQSPSYTYNSFKNNDVSVVKNNEGGIFFAEYQIEVKTTGTYTISCDADFSGKQIPMYFYSDKLWGTSAGARTITQKGKFTSNITFDNVGTYILGLYGDEAIGTTYQVKNLMIKSSTETATEYEEYGISPSPEFPSEIESVGYENLFNIIASSATINGLTFTINEDKSITINGIATATTNFKFTNSMTLPVGTYTLSGCPDGGSWETYRITSYNGQYYDFGSNKTFNITENLTQEWYIQIYSGATLNNMTFYPMLEKGTIAHPFIPYGKYGIEVKTVGENLLESIKPAGTTTTNGLNFVVNDDKTILVNGISTQQTTFLVSEFLYNNYGGKYVKGAPSGSSSSGYCLLVSYYDENSKWKAEVYDKGNGVLINGDYPFIQISILIRNGITVNNQIFKPMIVDNIDTEYKTYQKNTSVIVLDAPLRSLPNGVKDIAYIKNNRLYVDRYVGSTVLNGSESWEYISVASGSLFRNKTTINDAKDVEKIIPLSNNYTGITSYEPGTYRKNYNIYILQANEQQWIDIIDNRYTNNIDFKNWLSTHNTQLHYALSTPITEEIGEIEMPSTFKGVNHISTTDNLEPTINIEYVRDTALSNYVEDQINKVMAIEERHYSELVIEDDLIKESVTEISSNLSDMNQDVHTVQETLTSTEKTLEVISTNIDKTTGEIREVTTINGYKFNKDGLNIYTNENSFNTLIDNEGTYYKDGDAIISETTKDGFMATSIKNKGSEEYCYDESNKVYDFVKERIEVDGEYCYATFYNGVN